MVTTISLFSHQVSDFLLKIFLYIFIIYLVVPGLSCSLQLAGSSVFAGACRTLF